MQSSPSHTRAHTDALTLGGKFLCLFFFVVYRAVSGIDASVPSPRRERRSSLSRHELCFRNVRAIYTNASARAHTHTHVDPSASVRNVHTYAQTRVHRATIADACVWFGLTCAREPARLVGKREESKVEGSAPRYSSTFGSACQKALFTVSRENELFNSSRCRW